MIDRVTRKKNKFESLNKKNEEQIEEDEKENDIEDDKIVREKCLKNIYHQYRTIYMVFHWICRFWFMKPYLHWLIS